VLLFGGLGTWAAVTELSGAVVTSGPLVVDSNVKKVQHPTGGVAGGSIRRPLQTDRGTGVSINCNERQNSRFWRI
jgi:HlyD family secretion protein